MKFLSIVHAAQSAPITNLGPRLAMTGIMVAIVALAFFGMRRAWVAKGKRFELAPAPLGVSDDLASVAGPFEARFAGTVTAGNWLDRVTVHGLGTPRSISATFAHEGLALVDSQGTSVWSILIPIRSIESVQTGRGIAGDVVEPNGMIVVTWHLGYLRLATGIRVTRHLEHQELLETLNAYVTSSHASRGVNQ